MESLFDSPLLSRVPPGYRTQPLSASGPSDVVGVHSQPARHRPSQAAEDFTSPPLLPVHRYPSHQILSRLEEQWRHDPLADDPARASHMTSVALGYGLHMAAIGHTATFVVRRTFSWGGLCPLPHPIIPVFAHHDGPCPLRVCYGSWLQIHRPVVRYITAGRRGKCESRALAESPCLVGTTKMGLPQSLMLARALANTESACGWARSTWLAAPSVCTCLLALLHPICTRPSSVHSGTREVC
jgi:hypothetical protein